MQNASPAQLLASLPATERQAALDALPVEVRAHLAYHWPFWARPNQLEPAGNWTFWLILAGRGFGKTRTGSETVRRWIKTCDMVNLIGATVDDARDIMIEGESGILAICPDDERPEYKKSERKLIWPNGAVSLIFTADEPERLRGKQHKALWCFIAGTQVSTPAGDRCIETLRPGEYVHTRFGPRRVSAVSARRATIGSVRFSDGSKLTGTGNHPVLTKSGWTMLEELGLCQTVLTGRAKATATSARTSALAIGTAKALSSINTGGNGRSITARSRRTTTSIISTASRLITGLKIWSVSAIRGTRSITPLELVLLGPKRAYSIALAMTAEQQSANTNRMALASARLAASGAPKTSGRLSGFVSIAASSSHQDLEISVASVASTWEPAGEATVYDLTVEGAHEFIANGIVVHNCDEMAAWRYQESWDQAKFGLRLGDRPRAVVTTTPKPVRNVIDMVKDAGTVVTRGSTYDNRANLAPAFFDEIIKRYEGTRLGRQELMAELLLDTPGALWKRELFKHLPIGSVPKLSRIVVGVDPAISTTESSNETGIVGAGRLGNESAYILADRSGVKTPIEWATAAVHLYRELEADAIVAEVNQGGDMVESTIRAIDPHVPVIKVRASRGKYIRAEPISALYERGMVYHTELFEALEDQMCTFTPDFDRDRNGSPDRLDAAVWALTELFPSLTAPKQPEKRKAAPVGPQGWMG
jgi:phage terminase large subunit-like protein